MLVYQRVVDAVMKQQTPQLHQAVIKNVMLSMVDVNVFFSSLQPWRIKNLRIW